MIKNTDCRKPSQGVYGLTPREELYYYVRAAAARRCIDPHSVIDRSEEGFKSRPASDARRDVIAILARRNWASDRLSAALSVSRKHVQRILAEVA